MSEQHHAEPISAPDVRRAATTSVIWDGYQDKLLSLLAEFEPSAVCDIGGGRNPQLEFETARRYCSSYAILDVSQAELDLADDRYDKILGDASDPPSGAIGRFDFVFSRMVAEHVRSGEAFHRGVYEMLRPGGVAFHFFPTLYSLPFLANRLMPDAVADRVLDLVAPRDRSKQDRFRAHYSWTYGPTKRQLDRLTSVGFEVTEYTAGFGHDYYRRLPIVRSGARRLHAALQRHEVWHLSSYAQVVLRKPARAE